MDAKLVDFINACCDLQLDQLPAEQAISAVKPLLQQLCASAAWLPDICLQCIGEEKIVMLRGGENGGPMILIDTWPGGFEGGVHDHHTWGAVACVVGHERNRLYRKKAASTQLAGDCQLEMTDSVDLYPGDVSSMLPDVIHAVDNAMPEGEISISLHVYGKDLRQTERHLYDLQKHTVTHNPNTEFDQAISME